MKNEYFDDNGLLKPFGENSILFTAEYLTLVRNNERFLRKNHASKSIAAVYRGDEEFRAVPDEKWSHDNHTAVVCLSKIMGFEWHKSLYPKHVMTMLHPKDFIFYAYAAGRWYSPIAWLFLWVTSIAMIVSCMQKYKVRNGVKIVKTDGKLLAWLRCQAFNLPITWFLCRLALRRNSAFKTFQQCFNMYFTDPGHPNRQFKSADYEEKGKGL